MRAARHTATMAGGKIMESGRVKREPEGRLARRLPVAVRVYLESMEESGLIENAHTMNVAPQGVRLLTQNSWRAREEVLIRVSHTSFRIRGQVIYCQPREDGKFEVGVAWKNPPINWAEMPPEALAS